jgi:dipeptidyl aminopeptidase/acylaminoacyl peptidase
VSKPVAVHTWDAPAVQPDSGSPAAVHVPAPGLRTDTRPLPHDIAQLRMVSSVQIAPDGSRVAYTVRTPVFDPSAPPADDDTAPGWKVEEQIFITRLDGSAPRQATRGSERAVMPRWSPDGKTLGFLRARGARRMLHLLPADGGEARALDLGSLEPEQYEWSPDSASIAFLAEVPQSAEQKADAWRRGGAFSYEEQWRTTALYVVPASGGVPRRVSPAEPSFGTVLEIAWSPDGTRFAVVTAESANPYFTWSQMRLVIIPAHGDAAAGASAQPIEARPRAIGQIAWSPDSRYLAYEWAENSLSLLHELRVREVTGTSAGPGVWNASARLDPTHQGFAWARDSRSLVAHVYERTGSKLYRLSRDGRSARELGPLGRVLGRTVHGTPDGRFLATTSSTPTSPAAPTVIDLATGRARAVADHNPHVAEWTLARTEIVRWTSPEGVEIEGVLHVTPHARPGAPPPLVVMPHGGPDSVSLDDFSAWAQYFAARGYSVLRPNYRGGFGYGHAFYAANRGRLGAIEYMDIESGVDALIAAGKADPARLFYGGWSWGGYITTWTITQTQRYRAAMVGAGIVDAVAQYVASDINHGAVADWEFGGRPWETPDVFARSNPAHTLRNIKTPTIIFHGERDRRVPFIQGLYLYRALRDIGCKAALWVYPRESHSFYEPAHEVHMLETWARWFDAHLPG